MQVAEVQEGILDRVTECCATCGKVFWEGKHFTCGAPASACAGICKTLINIIEHSLVQGSTL